MRHISGLLVGCVLAACTSVTRVAERRDTRILLLVPEAVHAAEPKAERIMLLLGSGRIVVYEDAVLLRDAAQLVVYDDLGGRRRGAHDIVGVRAVQLELTEVTRTTSDRRSE